MIRRSRYEERILSALERSPVVTLLGPRQSGKTTLARSIWEKLGGTYLDLESAIKIVAVYLNSMRFQRTAQSDIKPFLEEAIVHILKASDYKIREFIKNSNVVLSDLANSNSTLIDEEFAIKSLTAQLL